MTTGKKVKELLKEPIDKLGFTAKLTTGQAVKFAREYNDMTQAELSAVSGLSQATLSSIENDRISLGAERAKTLARALKVHPAVLLFPGWNTVKESA